MRVPSLVVALVTLLPESSDAQCITGDFELETFVGECNYDNLLETFKKFYNDPVNRSPSCANVNAEDALRQVLGSPSDVNSHVKSICQAGFTDYYRANDDLTFETITRKNSQFITNFFDGGTDWNEEVATLYPPRDPENKKNPESNILKRDARVVKRFYENGATSDRVKWPSSLSNFQSCQINTAYCCWPSDRQANDGNGNCAKPYDVNCIDRDPADNTDLCYVEQNTGPFAVSMFPGDDGSKSYKAEGPIHCHGFSWTEDASDISAGFAANNLFYVSMYDHMHQRGYVRNIEGAPMCACAEQMPVVSRSDCTELGYTSTAKFAFEDNQMRLMVESVEIEFNSCQGINQFGEEDNNDLWSHAHRLFLEGKFKGEWLEALSQKLVFDDPETNCVAAQKRYMAEHQYKRGRVAEAEWEPLAGRDAMDFNTDMGPIGFTRYLDNTPNKIIHRVCGSCNFAYQNVYYKRLTPIPASLNLLKVLKSSREFVLGNVFGQDFEMYSTLEDAMAGVDKWVCPQGYNNNKGFPGGCGPEGQVLRNQESIFGSSWARHDVAFHVQKATVAPFQKIADTTCIGNQDRIGGSVFETSDSKLIVTGGGKELRGNWDDFEFHSVTHTDGFDITAKIEQFSPSNKRSRISLMARNGTDPAAEHFSIVLNGESFVGIEYRSGYGKWTTQKGQTMWVDKNKPVWLMLEKRLNKFQGFMSLDGNNWKQLYETVTLSSFEALASVEAGIAICARSSSKTNLIDAVVSEYENEAFNYPSATPTTSPAPSVISNQGVDIGRFRDGFEGSVSHAPNTNLWYLKSSGRDIYGSHDHMLFVPMDTATKNGHFDVTACIENLTGTHQWRKAGIVIRNSLEPGSPNVAIILTGIYGVAMTARASNNGGTVDVFRNNRPNYQESACVKLSRRGTQITGYFMNHELEWEEGGKTWVYFHEPPTVGLGASSHNTQEFMSAEIRDYTFDDSV